MKEGETFFISYTSADLAYVKWIAKTLEAEGYKCMYQDRDFVAGSNLVETIEQCIKKSDHTIAVLSKNYLDDSREWCRAERSAVFSLDPSGEHRRLICVCIEPYESLQDKLILLRPNISIVLSGLTSADARKTLFKKLSHPQPLRHKYPFRFPRKS